MHAAPQMYSGPMTTDYPFTGAIFTKSPWNGIGLTRSPFTGAVINRGLFNGTMINKNVLNKTAVANGSVTPWNQAQPKTTVNPLNEKSAMPTARQWKVVPTEKDISPWNQPQAKTANAVATNPWIQAKSATAAVIPWSEVNRKVDGATTTVNTGDRDQERYADKLNASTTTTDTSVPTVAKYHKFYQTSWPAYAYALKAKYVPVTYNLPLQFNKQI